MDLEKRIGHERRRGVYGTQGTPAAGNVPGARWPAASWIDGSGNLWLFGGDGYDAAGTNDFLNDLWQYSTSTGQWNWMGGSPTTDDIAGVYGTQGVAGAGDTPGQRDLAVSWIDGSGNFCLFGGEGWDLTRTGVEAALRFPVHPHMLRHACGFKLANDGHDTRALQLWLGHRNIQHTVRYTELSPARFKGFWRD
jgi:hypothetical protein